MARSWKRTGDIITIDVTDVCAGIDMWMLLRSDAHHDSNECDRALELKHLKLAKERDAIILDFGDLFDGMQTRTDPRRSKRDLRAEYLEDCYLDAITNEASRFYAPYVANWAMMGSGNHEQAIQKYSDHDPTSALIGKLNTPEHGGRILHGGYSGYVRVKFKWGGNKGRSESFLIYYTHGSGGGARRSKGVLKADLRQAVEPDADIIVSGHVHSSWQLPMLKSRVTQSGHIKESLSWHLQLPSYKRPGLWEESKEMAAHPVGAHWLHITITGGRGCERRVHIDPRWGLD